MLKFLRVGGVLFAAYIAGLLGGLTGDLLVDAAASHASHTAPASWAVSSAEVMSTANTYIVYTTFIFVVVTLTVTAAGLYFARWFSVTRESEIRAASQDFFKAVQNDEDFSSGFVVNLLKIPEVAAKLKAVVRDQLRRERETMADEDDQTVEPLEGVG